MHDDKWIYLIKKMNYFKYRKGYFNQIKILFYVLTNIIWLKWMYKLKHIIDGGIEKYKDWLVANDYA